MKNQETEKDNPHRYIGNNIPFPLKLAWCILILWILYYLFTYALPDLQLWLKKY